MALSPRFTRLLPVPWLIAGLLVACAEQPNAPIAVSSLEFSVITSNDPTRIVTVATLPAPRPSLACQVNVSAPVKPGAGV